MGDSNATPALYAGLATAGSKALEAIELGKKAADKKDLRGVIEAGKEFVRQTVFVTQKFAETMEAVGEKYEGQDKKAAVIAAAQAHFTPLINRAIDIPFIGEDAEAGLINKLIEQFISRTIDATVAAFKKNGWVIS